MSIHPNLTEKRNPCPTVLLADDHVRVLASAKHLLETHLRVVATVTNGVAALEAVQTLQPDLVVLDIEMPGMDGIQVAKEIRRLGLPAKIVFLTVYCDDDYIAAARIHANGYVLKSRMGSDLRTAIDEALSGRFFVSQRALMTE
jgi:DNA-binding NarL/FixJ family response regulator